MSNPTMLGTRLLYFMGLRNLTESELARRSGVPQPTIHRIIKGTSQSPRMHNVEKLAEAIGVDVAFLAYGQHEPSDTSSNSEQLRQLRDALTHALQQTKYQGPEWIFQRMSQVRVSKGTSPPSTTLRSYPLLTWHQASHPKTLDGQLPCETTGYTTQGPGFWLEMKGDAMAAPVGSVPSLPGGVRVLFDIEKTPIPGQLVLTLPPKSPEAVCRQLVVEGNEIYLKPLNPSYQVSPLSPGSALLAVAVEAKQSLV